MKNVMVRAWEIARGAVAKFGGSAREYFAQSLSVAWAESRKPQSRKAQAKAMSQAEWNENVNRKIDMIKAAMKEAILHYGSGLVWVRKELDDLIQEAIRDIRKERIVSVGDGAWGVVNKRIAA